MKIEGRGAANDGTVVFTSDAACQTGGQIVWCSTNRHSNVTVINLSWLAVNSVGNGTTAAAG
jgi:hypothetical protein